MSFLSRFASHSAIGVLESRLLPCASTLGTWSWNGFSSAAAPSTGGSAPTTRPPGAPASAPSGSPSTSASPADVADIVFKRIEVTPELKKWIYKEKPRLNAPFITVSALQNAMPRGLTLDELWEKVKARHTRIQNLLALQLYNKLCYCPTSSLCFPSVCFALTP